MTEDSNYHLFNEEENNRATIVGYNLKYNLDEFLTGCYFYFRYKGFKNIIIYNLTNILSLVFTLILSCFLFFLDWKEIQRCDLNDFSCTQYIINVNYHKLSAFSKLIFIFYTVIFILYILWCFFSIFTIIPKMKKIRTFYKKINISDNDLLYISWSNVLGKIEDFQNNAKFIHRRRIYNKHNKLMIIQRIMRRDNIFIALIDHNIFGTYNMGNIKVNLFTSKLMEWSLRLAFLNEVNSSVNKNVIYNYNVIINRFKLIGILNLIISPFSIIYNIIHFFLDNAVHIHTEPKEFMSCTWTNFAFWSFKDYNELNHITNQRLYLSLQHSINFSSQFNQIENDTITRFLIFIFGSLVSFIVILGFLNEAILSITIFNRNMWWYIAILTGIIAILKNNLQNLVFSQNPEDYLNNMKNNLGVKTKDWDNKNFYQIYLDMSKYLKYKFTTLLIEILSVFTTPYFLLFYLPQRTKRLCLFLQNNLIKDRDMGYIINSSTFHDEQNDSMKLKQSVINFQKYYHNQIVDV